jgi:glucose/arabinose dehydrogenase
MRAVAAIGLVATATACYAGDLPVDRIRLPEGFSISLYADEVPDAREMALAPSGTLFVGSRREGRVYAIPDADRDGRADAVVVVDEDLVMPSGLAFQGADLYVGALNRILRYADVEARMRAGIEPEVVTDTLPDATHHGWKYLRFGPDGHLYVPVGAPCNICLSEDERFASILRMDAGMGPGGEASSEPVGAASGRERSAAGTTSIYARGVRNSVGLAFHPATGELWFSDNGRDLMGDDVPAEEINRVTTPGAHFGYPFVHAGDVPDPEFGAGRDPAQYVAPTVEIQAHSAALGLAFYTGDAFPSTYRHALFVAEHGSWNRTRKVGYQVSVVRFEEGEPRYAPFATGWLEQDGDEERVWGRPNDVLMAQDGSLFVSDDHAGAIYRIRFGG